MHRGFIRTAALILLCAALGLAGSVVALRAAAPESRSVALGTVDVKVVPARGGEVDVYVPVVDWGVTAEPFTAPLAVELEFRSLDRDAALAALRSGGSADASLAGLEAELRDAVADTLRRAAGLALVGGAVGGLLGGALIGVFSRRRWLLLGPAAGLTVAVAAVALAGAGVSRFDYGALREPTFYAHGHELPRLLEFSERVLAAGNGYDDSYGEAVEGLTRLIAVADERSGQPGQIDRAVVVASDLHSNSFVLPALEGFTGEKPVFLIGDLTQRGTAYETAIVPGVARLGSPVVAVSGNHDSRPLMLAAARRGVVVLTRSGRLLDDGTTDGRPVTSVAGLRVAGFDDPSESATGTFEGRLLELKEQALVDARQQFLDWFEALPERPDVVLVHRYSFARSLLDRLGELGGEPVLILTGHDHVQRVEDEAAGVIVDGGSVGAGGAFGLDEESSGFALVHLGADERARAVDLVEVEPESGSASAHRIVLAPPFPPGGNVGAEAGADRP
jgi:predicted phosphodiesterase